MVEDQGRTVDDSGGSLPDGAPAVYVAMPWNIEVIEQMKEYAAVAVQIRGCM